MLSFLVRAVARPDPAPDADLLARFAADGDGDAFAALVERHGPLVYGTARRLLADPNSADDVFQATFLALARRAAYLRNPRALPAWLHRSAVRAALKVRRRPTPARLAVEPPVHDGPPDELVRRDLLATIDAELDRLPAGQRSPLVLCALEGKSLEDAASALGLSVGAVKGRLERGRKLLRGRLARRGLAVSALPVLAPAGVSRAVQQAAVLAAVAGRKSSWPAAVAAGLFGHGVTSLRTFVVFACGLIVGGFVAFGPTADPPKSAPRPGPAVIQETAELPLPTGAVRRFGTPQFRTGTAAVAVSGDTVVTLSPTGSVRRFDAATGRMTGERHLPLPETTLLMQRDVIRLSADGSIAVLQVFHATGRGHETIAWRTADGRIAWRHAKGGERVGSVDLSADGRKLAALVYEPPGTARADIVDLHDGATRTVPGIDKGFSIRLAPDGKRVLVGAELSDPAVNWTCHDETGRKLWTAPAGRMVSFSPDGSLIFADQGTYPNASVILDATTGAAAAGVTPPPGQTYEPWPPTVAPDGAVQVVRDAREQKTLLWDSRAGKAIAELALHPVGSQERFPLVAFAADGRSLYSTVGQLQRWDAATGRAVYPDTEPEGHTRPVAGLKFSPDGRELVSLGMDQRFFRWEAATGRALGSGRAASDTSLGRRNGERAVVRIDRQRMIFERLADPAHVRPEPVVIALGMPSDYTAAAAPTADGSEILALNDDRQKENRALTISVTDVRTEKVTSAVRVPWTVNVPRHPFSPCGQWVVIDGAVIHTRTGKTALKPTADIPNGPAGVPLWNQRPVWYSADGRFLAGSLQTLKPPMPGIEWVAVWELATGRALPPVLIRYEDQIALSPGGRTAVVTGLHGVVIHDLFGGPAHTLPPRDVTGAYVHTRGQTVAFAPDGRTFATGHDDGTILQWTITRRAEPGRNPDADAAWTALADPDPAVARPIVERLIGDPDAALALLKVRFRPPPDPEPADVAALVHALEADRFAVREAAMKKLIALGSAAEGALRKAVEGKTSAELAERVRGLLDRLDPPDKLPVQADRLRGIRAIEVLERIGTPAARELSSAWQKQVSDARLAAEADRAIKRGP